MLNSPYLVFGSHRPCPAGGFTLVEVTLSIGIVSIAFMALLGLLPAGLQAFRDATSTTVCAQIAQRVLSDAQQTDFDTLIDHIPREDREQDDVTFRAPSRAAEAFRYFDAQGNEVFPEHPPALSGTERTRVLYHVNTRITIRATRPKAAVNGSVNTGGDALDVALVTVQVAANPGNKPLPIRIHPPAADDENEPLRNLIQPTPGVVIATYSTMVARNDPSPPAP